jgi:hypothetical protein
MSRRLAHALLVLFAVALVGGACVVRTHPHRHGRPIVVEKDGKHKKHKKHLKQLKHAKVKKHKKYRD